MRHGLVASAVCTLLLLSGSMAHAQVSFGVTIGPPPPPRYYRVAPQPRPEFVWVEGYWYPQGHHYRWHDGYWTRPPFPQAYWVQPYYYDQRYYGGYWEDRRGRFEHDHRWDHERDRRDFNRVWRDEHHEDRH